MLVSIAERILQLAKLPALNSTWHASIGKDQIIELAALPRYLAYRTEKPQCDADAASAAINTPGPVLNLHSVIMNAHSGNIAAAS